MNLVPQKVWGGGGGHKQSSVEVVKGYGSSFKGTKKRYYGYQDSFLRKITSKLTVETRVNKVRNESTVTLVM